MARFGAFAGGLASGIDKGVRLSMDMDEAKDRKADRALQRQKDELGLEVLRREKTYDDELQAVTNKYTTAAPDQAAVDEAAALGDSTASQVKRAPREMTLADQVNMNKEIGALQFRYKKISHPDYIALPQRLRGMQKEGLMQALDEMASTNDVGAGIESFNKLGDVKIKAYMSRDAVDKLTGLPTKEVTVRTEDDKVKTFSLAELARSAGSAKEYIEWAKLGETARSRAAQEHNVDRQATRDEQRHQETMGSLDIQGRRADAAMTAAQAAATRAERSGSAGSRQAQWAEARRDALMATGYSEKDATDIAYGAKSLSPRDARARSEAMASRAKDDMGQPLSAQAQRRYADQVYGRIMGSGASPGLEPVPAAPGAPAPATPKPLNLNQYVIGR